MRSIELQQGTGSYPSEQPFPGKINLLHIKKDLNQLVWEFLKLGVPQVYRWAENYP